MRRLPPGLPPGRPPRRLSAAGFRLLHAAAAAVVLTLVVPATAYADPSTSPSPSAGGQSTSNVGPATAGTPVCTLTSSTLTQISGMVVTANAIMAVEARATPNALTIFTIDGTSCKATAKNYSGIAGTR